MADLLVICPTTEDMRARLSEHFDPIYWDELKDQGDWLKGAGESILYVLTDGHFGIKPKLLAALPNLKAISSYGVGYDAIDTDATTAKGVPVSHTPNVLNDEVATTALFLYIAAWRNMEAEMANARTGAWESTGGLPLARSADKRKVGILGLGRIGKAVAEKLQPFGCEISYFGRSKQDVPYKFYSNLLEMAKDCDTLISVLPGGASTNHLISSEVIDALGPDGCLINVGRGSVVDEDALTLALSDGRLGRAGLDVFEKEPYISNALRDLPNVIMTPHIGSATVETRQAMGNLSIDNLVHFKKDGTMITPVPESKSLL